MWDSFLQRLGLLLAPHFETKVAPVMWAIAPGWNLGIPVLTKK